MRIRQIIRESLLLPVRYYKSFLVVFFLAVLCEIISEIFYSLEIGQWSLLIMIVNSILTLMILGIMISITNNVVSKKRVEYFDFVENLLEGLKEYIITMYYMVLTIILSSFFIVPTGVYANFLHIHEYILSGDINTTFMTVNELSKDIPVSLQLDLIHSLQMNLIISIVIFVLFTSFGFIGKIILNKTDNMKKSLSPAIINSSIQKIGYKRYLKFIFAISVIVILLFNLLWLLDFLVSDIIISALLESIILFFATNAFYLILSETDYT